MQLLDHLLRREATQNPIRVGLVGCGQEGSGMVHVTHKMAGMETFAIADLDLKRPLKTLHDLGIANSAIQVTNQKGPAEDALRAGHYVVTEDANLLPQLDSLDALVEATGVTEVGAQVAWQSIMRKKHVVMLNVETDVTVGLMLSRLAEQVGCVYTASTGDEPGVCKQLYDFARTLGFEVVCLGKGKNNPIDYYANPDSCRVEAEGKNMNPKMLAAFQDGTASALASSVRNVSVRSANAGGTRPASSSALMDNTSAWRESANGSHVNVMSGANSSPRAAITCTSCPALAISRAWCASTLSTPPITGGTE